MGWRLSFPAKASVEFEPSGCYAPETCSGTHLDTHLLWLIACFAQCIHFIISFKWVKTTRISALSIAVTKGKMKRRKYEWNIVSVWKKLILQWPFSFSSQWLWVISDLYQLQVQLQYHWCYLLIHTSQSFYLLELWWLASVQAMHNPTTKTSSKEVIHQKMKHCLVMWTS